MAELPLNPPGNLFKENYVPLEQHEKNNLNFGMFFKEKLLGWIIGGAGGTLVGNIFARITRTNPKLMGTIGGMAGALVADFRMWSKTNRRQKHIQNNLESVKEALDPTYLEQETKKEAALIADLKALQEKLDKPVVHAEEIKTRRSEDAVIQK